MIWSEAHERAAAAQGWGLFSADEGYQIQRWDDAPAVSWAFGMPVPSLPDDRAAVGALREAYERGDEHAIVAHSILAATSPREFNGWSMHDWRIREAA